MLSSAGNARDTTGTSDKGTTYSYQSWQRKRHAAAPKVRAHNEDTMATNNTNDGKNIGPTQAAMLADSVEAFEAWLNDPTNFTKRTINKVETMVPYTCTLSANVPADVYWSSVHAAAGDKGKLDDGDMTNFVRGAVWVKLGYTQEEYDTWAAAEKERITEALKARMSGVHSASAEKVKAMQTENQSLAAQLAELQKQLAALTGNS